MQIRKINAEQTLPIRHRVLWPSKPQAFCEVKGDDNAQHWGAFIDHQLVSVGSLYIDNKNARLRKFATLAEHQGKGIGSQMLNTMMADLRHQGIEYFWLDARESAVAFYKKFGLASEGNRFYKGDIAYFKMAKLL